MPTYALALGDQELEPLVQDPSSMDAAIDVMEQATLAFHRGEVREHNLVDQTQGSDPPNLLQIHFAAADQLITGFQLFAETRGGAGPQLPNARFVALLDPQTRQLQALVDYWCLSPLRVAASAGIGTRRLTPEGARTAGILGSSKQARAQLQAIVRTVPTLERARVFSPTREHREAFAREVQEWLDLPVEPVGSPEEAVDGADIVGLANNARQPVISDLSHVKPGALVVSIGSNQLPASVIDDTRVVATTWDTLTTRQPYATRIKDGSYTREQVAAELAPLILGEATPRRRPEDMVVFEVTRLNIWAVAIAHWAYQWAQAQGIGTRFSLSGE